ncbi:hypothetical protein [Enterococcus faecalis]|uniref:hypothetical protein n=1 Tax=Enterococcus faecalis TaxID=1351 RepID=UPI0005B55817|nr:hypothetical protein [Enterococcus faecalis]
MLHRSLDLTDCFETKFIQSVKEMKKVERAFYLSLLFALFMLLLSYIGLLFRQRIFAWLFLGSLCAFCIILISFMGYLTYYRKRFKEMSRIRRVEKLELFDILLIQYGLDEDKEIIKVLETLRLNYMNRCKAKERKHDVFFKYMVTFLLSLVIFIGKEKWERVKPGLSESDFDKLFQTSLMILSCFGLISIYMYGTFYNHFGRTKEEKLIKVLEELLLYRQGVEIALEN